MFLVSPSYLFTSKGFVTDHSFVFDTKILWLGKTSELPSNYEALEVLFTPKNCAITPGLINAHVHLEFSANKSSLKYGRFLPWLYSVIDKREEIIGACKDDCIKEAIETMVHTGTTAFGAISSYGTEMQACIDTPAKVVFFNELIGSNATMADALWGDFIGRLNDSKKHQNASFFPAVAVHSPYSVHPVLVKKAVQVADNESLPLSAHLLESDAERAWLENNSGDFAPFFKELLKQDFAVTGISEFIESFDNKPTLFTHATKLSQSDLEQLSGKGHRIVHCPISNRLLGNGVLDIKKLYEYNLDYLCGTDGLSSNYTLNLFDELQAALFMHDDANLETLAISLLHSVTTLAGPALGLNCGKLEQEYDADFLIFEMPEDAIFEEDIALHILLKNHPLQSVYINGNLIKEPHGKA